MDITVSINEFGEFDPIDTSVLGVTGRDGYGDPTPTVRELIAILRALPEHCMDLPVGRYGDEGIRGLNHKLHFPRQEGPMEDWTAHVQFW